MNESVKSSATRLRWGILGCARISRRGLIPGIQKSATGDLVAIGSRRLETALEWSREFGIPRAYGSYEELLKDSEIDAVYIPLPNELHLPWTIAAADAGKHVLCEKPLALNAGEAGKMIDHCRSKHVTLMEAFMWRHQPRVAAIRQKIREGLIGELRLIRSSFSFPIAEGDWRLDADRGGGALWDVGCYGVNTARLFSEAEPTEIQALARFGPSGVDLSLAAQLGFAKGVIAQIDCSFEQPYRCRYELTGTRGTLIVPDAYLPPDRPLARLRGQELNEEWTFDGRDQYSCMVDAFAESVAAGNRLVDPAEDGLNQMKALDAILAKAKSS